MNDSEYPEASGSGRMAIAEFEYLAEGNSSGLTTQGYLNLKSVDGWRLITVNDGYFYFQREGRCLYEETEGGRLERRRFGNNS